MGKVIKEIADIINEVGDDKTTNIQTTSHQFKRDLWSFFRNMPNIRRYKALEFGTGLGQTTRVLSFLFQKVYSVSLPLCSTVAVELNADRNNITYLTGNLYNGSRFEFKHCPLSVVMFDAGNTFDNILDDFTRTKISLKITPHVYLIFNNYGVFPDVFHAVEQLVYLGEIEKITYLGLNRGDVVGVRPKIVLREREGIICKLAVKNTKLH